MEDKSEVIERLPEPAGQRIIPNLIKSQYVWTSKRKRSFPCKSSELFLENQTRRIDKFILSDLFYSC